MAIHSAAQQRAPGTGRCPGSGRVLMPHPIYDPRRQQEALNITVYLPDDMGERVAAMIERDGSTTTAAIVEETAATTAQAHAALSRLRSAGRVRLEGRGAGSRYVAAS